MRIAVVLLLLLGGVASARPRSELPQACNETFD
jgi:hypothetical protein